MSIFDKFKKTKPVPQTDGYHREPSIYERPGQPDHLQEDPDTVALVPDQDDALKQLYDDETIHQRMQEELNRSSANEKNNLGQMLGKGVGTLTDSLKKATTGESLLDDRDNDRTDKSGKD